MEIKKEFKITSKAATYYLGLEIQQEIDGSININQKGYTQKLLERFGMENCRSVTTPMLKDGKENEGGNSDIYKNFPYRQAVGALIYLMSGTRPDINYAVSVVSRNLENPTSRDIINVKRIFRYLHGTLDYGIRYQSKSKPGILEAYSDSDHGGDKSTGRSTSGAVCIFAGGVISWFSRRQQSVAISTTEAEIVVASEAARGLLWLKRLFSELTILNSIPSLQVDNEAAVRLAMNPEFHHRTKHINIRNFFVRELVIGNEIAIQRTSTEDQLADMMTKPLHSPRLRKLISNLGIFKLLNKGEC